MAQKLRLICPSCSAQYEVDESVIPEDGRDVQCSNCDHTWWQTRETAITPEEAAEMERRGDYLARNSDAASPVDATDEGVASAPAEEAHDRPANETSEPAEAASVPQEDDRTPPSSVPEASSDEDEARWPEFDEASERPSATPAAWPVSDPPRPAAAAMPAAPAPTEHSGPSVGGPAPVAARRPVDDAVLDVLREEAQRETEARRSEATAESATEPAPDASDLGRGPGEREAAVRERLGSAVAATGAIAPAASTRDRSPRLPNIDEINSTLDGRERGHATSGTGSAADAERRRSGFRLGFFTMILVAVAIAVAYLYAGPIGRAAPALEPTLGEFVAGVDTARVWLEGAAQNATATIRGLTDQP